MLHVLIGHLKLPEPNKILSFDFIETSIELLEQAEVGRTLDVAPRLSKLNYSKFLFYFIFIKLEEMGEIMADLIIIEASSNFAPSAFVDPWFN